MSNLSCIGYIMGGSDHKELLCTIYAENSVNHILIGHAYSRAVLKRSGIISSLIDMKETLTLYEDATYVEMLLQDPSLNELIDEFENQIKELDMSSLRLGNFGFFILE